MGRTSCQESRPDRANLQGRFLPLTTLAQRNFVSSEPSPIIRPHHSVAPHASSWTFFTNHAHVLICLAGNPDLRIRDLAPMVGITERAVQRILRELAEEGFVEIEKIGRRNHYNVRPEHHLRHPVEEHATVGDLINLIVLLRPGAEGSPAE